MSPEHAPYKTPLKLIAVFLIVLSLLQLVTVIVFLNLVDAIRDFTAVYQKFIGFAENWL